MKEDTTWRRWTAVPLLVASVAYLIAYSWRVIAVLDGTAWWYASSIVWIARGLFIVDYLVRFGVARQKWLWFRTHLADLVIAVVPVLRLVRLLRIFTELPARGRTRGARLRSRIGVYGFGSVVVLIYIAALQTLDVERHAANATIIDFGDAVWWACATATTTGYGDFTPVTGAGRCVGVALMFGGIALTGTITGLLSSYVIERVGRNADDSRHPATRAQVRELTTRIEALIAAQGAGVRGVDTGLESDSDGEG